MTIGEPSPNGTRTRSGSSDLRFRDAMPKPVLVAFTVFAVLAVGAIGFALFGTPDQQIALHERRPPPAPGFSHDVGDITPAPLPRQGVPSIAAPCPEYANVRFVAGGDGVTRLREALRRICPLVRGGLGEEVTAAARALDGATLRFGRFAKTGVDSTLGFADRTIWLNARFAIRNRPLPELIPVVLHEALHLARAGEPVTASQELAARRVETAACRQFLTVEEWPRSCRDARALAEMPEARAIELLVAAGFARAG